MTQTSSNPSDMKMVVFPNVLPALTYECPRTLICSSHSPTLQTELLTVLQSHDSQAVRQAPPGLPSQGRFHTPHVSRPQFCSIFAQQKKRKADLQVYYSCISYRFYLLIYVATENKVDQQQLNSKWLIINIWLNSVCLKQCFN